MRAVVVAVPVAAARATKPSRRRSWSFGDLADLILDSLPYGQLQGLEDVPRSASRTRSAQIRLGIKRQA